MEYQVDNEKNFETWEEFLEEWELIKQFREKESQKTKLYVSDLIYRGQADSNWKLETTLERFTGENKYEIDEYYRKIHRASFDLEAFTRERWNLPSPHTYSDLVKDLDVFSPHQHLFSPDFDLPTYFLYFRHHSFPSPLLDWTRSPFIAAYFAFSGQPDKSQYVSIYIFLENMGFLELEGGREPAILNSLGPFIKSHERHFLQQCEYTFCIKKEEESQKKFFVSHQEALSRKRYNQKYIWKFNIRASEKKKVLRILDSVNINAFSLFQSVESLMATAAARYFFLKE